MTSPTRPPLSIVSPQNTTSNPATPCVTSFRSHLATIECVTSLLLLLLLLFTANTAVKIYPRNLQEPFDSAKYALVSEGPHCLNRSTASTDVITTVKLPGGHILFVPTTRVSNTRGVAYIPGALVNHLAYALLCREIARLSKLPVLLLRVTLRLAPLGKSSIASALKTHATTAQVTSWVLGGHSLGGVAASSLADLPSITAIFLHASYPKSSLKKLPVLQVLADHDDIIKAKGIEEAKALYMPAAAVVHVIAGGNHAGFVLYGPQKFPCADGERTISLAEQQLQVARTTADWLRTLVHAE